MPFPFYPQYDSMDCGPTCLRMVAKYYGKSYSLQSLRLRADISREGVSLLGLSEAAQAIGFHSFGVQIDFEQLCEQIALPAIVSWNQNHFIIVHNVQQSKFKRKDAASTFVHIADPAAGLVKLSRKEFMQGWTQGKETGLALALEPTPSFYEDNADESPDSKLNFTRILQYLRLYKKYIFQLLVGLLIGGALQLLLPLLTQAIVDTGIVTNDLNFIYLILIAQIMVFIGHTVVEFVRSWLLMFISTRINLSILSDFFTKLMKLPAAFFDAKAFGDIIQRIGDHYRIESFLTGNSISFIFSLFTLLVFGALMANYSLLIFFVFIIGSALYVVWILLFMRYRKNIDYKKFSLGARNQNNVIELLRGMQEIKLAGAETSKLWEWERLQILIFKLNISNLKLSQYQQAGAVLFNQGKIIIITYLSARAVVQNELSLGQMMALQYILGQLNGPIEQLVEFARAYQDAKLSLERLNEIQEMENEESPDQLRAPFTKSTGELKIQNLSFKYPGSTENVLSEVDLTITSGKVTAIVGMSGSGKTTLLKLLLRFYEPIHGRILLGETPLSFLSHSKWRKACGVVLQDGYIFSDTIAQNIAFGDEALDSNRLLEAVRIANIEQLVEGLPLGLNTKIGNEGVGLSQGQRQRILIARAVYKNPDFIFFDEATSALDSTNESIIVRNLNEFFLKRTVLIVAHRLSTVKKADHIIVMEKGRIVEEGNHNALLIKKGKYFNLVKDQLELAE